MPECAEIASQPALSTSKEEGFLRRGLRSCGVDRAIAYTVIGRSWSFLAGPITLLLIARYLTRDEQGFYYTFGSVLGLYVLFELGLSFVLFQFASHERAHLAWTESGELRGEPRAQDRYFSLLRKAILWYTVLAALVLAVLIPCGLGFFSGYNSAGQHAHIAWLVAWVWVVTATAADLLSAPVVAMLEGAGLFTQVALVRTGQAVAGGLLTWLVLVAHGRLLASPISNTVVVVGWWSWLAITKRPFLKQLFGRVGRGRGIDWRREVWPFQWRIALTGISSYFIYLLFTPVLFKYQGAAIAGQMGMSATVFTTISSVAISWVSTKMSPFGTLIAQREFKQLDKLFFPSLWKSLGVFLLLSGAFLLFAYGLNLVHHPLARRVLPVFPLALLMGTTLMNHVVGVEALYLRAHKQEPFLVLSIVVAMLTAVSTYVLGKDYSATAMIAGNFVITMLFSLGWGTYIFTRKRSDWHQEAVMLPSSA